MTAHSRAHSARQVLASVRSQHPQLGGKLHLATGPAEQLALFELAAPKPEKEVSLGLKDHEWDLDHPIFRTRFSVLVYCKKCKAQMRVFKGASATFAVPIRRDDGRRVLVFSYRRPFCTSKESGNG
jgi:hypothetical protein